MSTKKDCLIGFGVLELVAAMEATGVVVMIPSMIKSFSISSSNSGVLLSSYLVPFCLFLVPLGWLADKKSKIVTFLCSVVLFAISSFFCAIVENKQLFYISRFLQGSGSAGIFACEFAIIVDYWDKKWRAIEKIMSGFAIGILIGPVFGALFSQNNLWRLFFLISGILATASLYLVYNLPSIRSSLRSEGNHSFNSKKNNESYLPLLIWTMVINFVISFTLMGENLLISMDAQKRGLGSYSTGAILLLIAGGIVVNSVLGIGSRFETKKDAVIYTAYVLSVSYLLLSLVGNPIYWASFVVYLIIGVCVGIIFSSIELVVLSESPKRSLTTTNAWVLASMQGGYALSSYFTPKFYIWYSYSDTNLYLSFFVLAVTLAFNVQRR